MPFSLLSIADYVSVIRTYRNKCIEKTKDSVLKKSRTLKRQRNKHNLTTILIDNAIATGSKHSAPFPRIVKLPFNAKQKKKWRNSLKQLRK